jgi:CDP-glycerol glycerophosphotransferase
LDATALGRWSVGAQPLSPSTPVDGDDVWELSLVPDASGARIPLSAGGSMPRPRLALAGSELLLQVTRTGRVRVVDRLPSPEVGALSWGDDGVIEISGRYAGQSGQPTDLVLIEVERALSLTVPMTRVGDRFTVTFRPASMVTPGGLLPLDEGEWGLWARAADRATGPVRVKVDQATLGSLPKGRLDGWRHVTLLETDVDGLALEVSAALPASERARGGQRRLRSADYPAYLRLPLRDQVLIDGHGRGRYGVDARAVHEELTARDTGLDVVWTTDDGTVAAPAGARAVPRHGREWYEAFARSRYVVMSDLLGVPELASRPGQTVVQTWHGVPVTAIGLDDDRAGTRLGMGWQDRVRREAARWDLVVSPGAAATPVLRQAFDPRGRIIETGLPRHDLLCSDQHTEIRAARAAAARKDLGIGADQRVVLWAPTSRSERQAGWLDPNALARALGDDHVLVVRPHPKVRDGVAGADGRKVIDASWVGDVRDLLLIADVLVTDYSSLFVDFALTGRPIVFFTPDLDHVRKRLYLALDDLPGAIVTDPAELGAAILAAPESRGSHDTAYRSLVRTHLPHADGGASSRVVDAMLGQA